MTESKIHRFEERGLGRAPFAFVDVFEHVTQEGQPAGTCSYCGNGIKNCCVIRSADGRRFIVGNDCVAHTGDEGLKRLANVAKRDAAEARRMIRLEAELAEQRVRNGGKTDNELAAERVEAERKAKASAASAASEWLWSVLLNSGTNFGLSVGGNLKLGIETLADMSPRCVEICKDIYCKQAGRRGSKAYEAAAEEFEAKVTA